MKKVFTICAVLLMTASLWAQSPQKMSYQAVVRDGSNNLVSSTAVGMQISILQGSASGTAVYVETQTPTSNINGLVSVEIGAGTVVSGSFGTIDWANGPYFIQTETDPTGGTNYTITGTSQLLSVPYALHAKTAETVTGAITETDTLFGASVASGITATDTANWNNHTVDTHIDSLGIANLGYVAGGITTETDPVFGASVASGITATDTTNWNNKQDQLTAGANITIAGNTISAAGGGGLTHYVGELFGGGIVVAVWKENGVEKGLIASLTDISPAVQYSSVTGTLIGTIAQSPIDGPANTAAILNQGDVSGAAYLCDNYTSGGFNDWYLPSREELYLCYNAFGIVNMILGATNGFQLDAYWSSTEYNASHAWRLHFNNGNVSSSVKGTTYMVRTVRRF